MEQFNPFVISGYKGPEYFCDREAETQNIISALGNGRNLTLLSPRRLGKSGLIKHVFNQLKESDNDIITIYLDVFSTQNLYDFVRLFAEAVLGRLDTVPQMILSRVNKFIHSCRPSFTFDEVSGAPKFVIDIDPRTQESTLKEIFEYISSSEKRCCIAIDEFQQIAEYPEKGVEALLRSYIQFLPNAYFIFSGSKKHMMSEMFLSSKRPFYQSTQMMSLDPIDREKYYEFASKFFQKRGYILPREAFDGIYEHYQGWTWYIQCILNRLYAFGCDVNPELALTAQSQIVDEYSSSYADLLRAYSPGCVRLLRAIALEGCVKEPLSGSFISKYMLRAASSVSTALKTLMANELVYRSDEGYMIYDRFMAVWLKGI